MLAHNIGPTYYPAKEGEDGGSVCELSRCDRGEEDTRIVLRQELWNKVRIKTKKEEVAQGVKNDNLARP